MKDERFRQGVIEKGISPPPTQLFLRTSGATVQHEGSQGDVHSCQAAVSSLEEGIHKQSACANLCCNVCSVLSGRQNHSARQSDKSDRRELKAFCSVTGLIIHKGGCVRVYSWRTRFLGMKYSGLS